MVNDLKESDKACHNCRRGRTKCDRTLPHCLKCIKKGHECMGYQRLFRWERGIASRGKMAGVILGEKTQYQAKDEPNQASPLGRLEDPLVQDLNRTTKMYLQYFASHVCKDLVLYDSPRHNLFRELIPLTHAFPVLLEIMVANSALRMANAYQQPLPLDVMAFPQGKGQPTNLVSSSATQQTRPYQDAFAAKHRALHLLQLALTGKISVDTDVTLAVVLLFVELELLESGQENWASHINGARTIIERLCGADVWTQSSMSPLRSWLISNCLVFDILGSTFARPTGLLPNDALPTNGLCLLQDAEGNHCSSFPTYLLQLMQTGAQLLREESAPLPGEFLPTSKQEQALLLLCRARSFDPAAWAVNVQSRSPASDLSHRTHVASGHCTAVCIYLSRVVLFFNPASQLPCDLETLVAGIIENLSFIGPKDALFTATTWPAFIAGAETSEPSKQQWVTRRFQELWLVEPWGTIRGALYLLHNIWEEKSCRILNDQDGVPLREPPGSGDWIGKLRGMDVDWLII